jgi:hypothetical protein
MFKSPLSAFRDEVQRRGIADRITYVRPDQIVSLQPATT